MKKSIIQIGQRFGRLVVVKEVERLKLPSGQTNRAFLCRCDCGNENTVRLAHLSNNKIQSCGCVLGEKHGMRKTRLYTIWRGMKNRCYGNKTIQPHLYKDKGITVCDNWRNSFISFMVWARKNAYRDGLQIDRINNSLGYYPENCQFVTPMQNSSNRCVTIMVNYHGESKALSLLLHELDKFDHYNAILRRIKRGWNHSKAIDIPIKIGNYKRAA